MDVACSPDWRSAPRCSASTCSATRCATRSIRAHGVDAEDGVTTVAHDVIYDVDALRRDEFPWALAGDTIYLNNASTGPLPERTVRALTELARLRATPHRLSHEEQFGTLERARELIARLIGARRAEIALAMNTGVRDQSRGVGAAAGAGRRRVVAATRSFPRTSIRGWRSPQRRGVEYRPSACDDGVLDEDALERELEDERVRVRGGVVGAVRVRLARRPRRAWARVPRARRVVRRRRDSGSGRADARPEQNARRHPRLRRAEVALSPWGTGFVYVRKELIRSSSRRRELDGRARLRRFHALLDYDLTWRDRRAAVRVHHAAVPGLRGDEREPRAASTSSGRRMSRRIRWRLAQAIVDWARIATTCRS